MLRIPSYSKYLISLNVETTVLTDFYSDSIATGLVNALLNSGDDFQMEKGRDFLKRLKKQLKKRKRDNQDEDR